VFLAILGVLHTQNRALCWGGVRKEPQKLTKIMLLNLMFDLSTILKYSFSVKEAIGEGCAPPPSHFG